MSPLNSTPIGSNSERLHLTHILSLYPILESVLHFSHRSNVVNLAQTCRTLRDLLTTRLRAQSNLFRSCTVDLQPCTLCKTPVCEGCRQYAMDLEKPSSAWSSREYDYALVCRGTAESREGITSFLEWIYSTVLLEPVRHEIVPHPFCDTCFGKYLPRISNPASGKRSQLLGHLARAKEAEWNSNEDRVNVRILVAASMMLSDVPNYHKACACDRDNTGCDRWPHIVKVRDIPMESELVGNVCMPGSLPGAQFGWNNYVPLYVLDVIAERRAEADTEEAHKGHQHTVRSTWVPLVEFWGPPFFVSQ